MPISLKCDRKSAHMTWNYTKKQYVVNYTVARMEKQKLLT